MNENETPQTDVHFGYDYPPAAKKDKRKAIIAIVVTIAIVVGVGLFVLGVINKATHGALGVTKDSGVAACEQMAAKAKSNTKSDNSSPMTEAQFKDAKKPWENSRYADLKVAGTNVTTTVYDFSKKMEGDNADLGTAFAALSTLQAQWGQLQTACANHGVTIPALNMNN